MQWTPDTLFKTSVNRYVRLCTPTTVISSVYPILCKRPTRHAQSGKNSFPVATSFTLRTWRQSIAVSSPPACRCTLAGAASITHSRLHFRLGCSASHPVGMSLFGARDSHLSKHACTTSKWMLRRLIHICSYVSLKGIHVLLSVLK